MLVAIAVAVIIAAFALTLVHRGSESSPTTANSSVSATRQQLVQMLGVLRRRQTKADLDPEVAPGLLHTTGDIKLDRALVRVVVIPAWHAKVGIEPATWQPSPSSRRRSEGLDLTMWIGSKPTIPPSSGIDTGPRPTSVDTIRADGLTLADNVRGENLMDGVMLVPDGVARITLRPIRLTRAPVMIAPSRFGTATGTVHDNIAAFQLSIPTVIRRNAFSSTFITTAIAHATWFDASGNVIKHTTTNLPVAFKVLGHRPRPRSASPYTKQRHS